MEIIQLKECIAKASNQYYRLLIIVGPPGSGKSRLLRQLDNVSYIHLSLELAKQLIIFPKEDRALHINDVLSEIISTNEQQVIVLDNIELLFLPELRLNPLRALEHLSRNKTLVVAWTGSYNDRRLAWAEPGHPEYRVYDDKSCPGIIVKLID